MAPESRPARRRVPSWRLERVSSTAIAAHALLSDCHSAALTTADGSVDWLCFPRFDSPSVFGRLLDDAAGHWSIRPAGEYTTSRRYLDRTLVLETTFHTPTGTVVLTDALATGTDNHGHALGMGAPHLLIRSLAGTGGTADVEVCYAPRPEYGLLRPLLSNVDGGVTARGGAEWLVLSSPVPMRLRESTATARVTLREGETLRFALHRSTLEERPARNWAQAEIAERLDATVAAWRSWSRLHQNYEGPWRDLVHHSGRVLQGLTFQPSGAIVAAATTSLPERVGGERNWDYRYSWVRDASFTMEALWVAACPDEASDFFAFMTTAAAAEVGPATPLQIMFGVGGEHDLPNVPCRTCAAGGTASRSGSATAPGASGRSTCTASCSPPRTGWSTRSTTSTPTCAPSWSRWLTRRPSGGARPIRASGRSAASHGISSTRR